MKATVGADGLALAPPQAPPVVQRVIAAGNKIATMPYRDERLVAGQPGLEVVLEAGRAQVQRARGGLYVQAGLVDRGGLGGEEAAFAGLLAFGVAEAVSVARSCFVL